jgi:hypothetical protein
VVLQDTGSQDEPAQYSQASSSSHQDIAAEDNDQSAVSATHGESDANDSGPVDAMHSSANSERDGGSDIKATGDRTSGVSTNSAGSADGLSTLKDTSTDKPSVYASNASEDSQSLPDAGDSTPTQVVSLKNVPFTRDINPESILRLGHFMQTGNIEDNPASGSLASLGPQSAEEALNMEFPDPQIQTRRTTGVTVGAFKISEATFRSKTFQTLPLPEPLSMAHRGNKLGQRKYPNTPLALAWFESGDEWYMFIGLLSRPHLLKIVPPKHTKPDKPGRFNVLPIDHTQVLLADEASHQIQLLNYQRTTLRHLAGCGKRGHLDGPLDSCKLHSPCSMTLDPRSHFIYIADRGNHCIRKIDLMSGLMSTVCGNGIRGNCDGCDSRRQALDSPFEVSWVEPHYLVISCADNAIRSFNLKTQHLETILVGS